MRFRKRPLDRGLRDWRGYREFTREDFRQCCAYCFRHENEAGGRESFDQDHFIPRSVAPERTTDYANLYWCCRGCNGSKSDHWPTSEQLVRGERFCDSCEADPMDNDYIEDQDHMLREVTPKGRFTITHIRLNRDALRSWRRWRIGLQESYAVAARGLRSAVALARDQSGDGREAEEVKAVCAEADAIADSIEVFVRRTPFVAWDLPYVPGLSERA